ncbi:UNVERIFIED_CONTAM: hypothetical protein ABIC26_004557 [Paenibacillus sp. PvR008]
MLPRAIEAAAGNDATASLIVTGAWPGARLELYNAQQELVSEGAASGEGTYVFTPVPEGVSYYVLQFVNGMESAPSRLVYAQGLTAQRVADSITSLAAPAASDTLLKLPAVPEGFRLVISSTSQPDMIRTDGAIFPAATQTAVSVILEVTKVSDGSHSLTQQIEVNVPAKIIVDTGNSNKKDQDEDNNASFIQLQPGFSEQGKAIIIYTPSATFLDGQINQARLVGKAYADIHLEQEKDTSRVVLPYSSLNKWDKVGAAVISQYGTLMLSSDVLTRMFSGQQDVALSFQRADAQRTQQIQDWAGQQSNLKLIGTAVEIKANVTGSTSHIVLPLDAESIRELQNEKPQFSILVIHDNGEQEILKGTAVRDSKGNLSAVSFDTTRFSTFAIAASTDTKSSSDNTNTQDGTTNSSDSQGAAPVWPDVQGHWAAKSLQSLADKGWIQGYKDGNMRPERAVSRAEFVSILTRALGTTGDESVPTSFTDMKGHWAASAVDAAHRQGWIEGLNAQTFGPDESLTREQAMVILSHAMADKASASGTVTLQSYKDEQQIASWASTAFKAAISSRWISRYPDGTLKPKAAISRGEMAELLVRIFK